MGSFFKLKLPRRIAAYSISILLLASGMTGYAYALGPDSTENGTQQETPIEVSDENGDESAQEGDNGSDEDKNDGGENNGGDVDNDGVEDKDGGEFGNGIDIGLPGIVGVSGFLAPFSSFALPDGFPNEENTGLKAWVAQMNEGKPPEDQISLDE